MLSMFRSRRFRKLAAGLALAGFLFTGALAGVGYSQARASTTVGVITIRSIISGTLTIGNGATFGYTDALFSRDAAGKVALKTNSAQATGIRQYYGTGVDYIEWADDSSNDHVFNSTYPEPTGVISAALNAVAGQNCTAGAHTFKTTFITAAGETIPTLTASNSVTCDGTHTTVALTSVPTGFTQFVTGRNVYATKAGGSTYFLVAASPVIADNTTTTYTFNTADASLTVAAPTTDTAVATMVTITPDTGQILANPDNTSSTAVRSKPTYSFAGLAGYGMFYDGPDTGVGFSINGTQNTLINVNGLYFNGGVHMPDTGALSWASSYLGASDVILQRSRSGAVVIGDGTSGQLVLEINGGAHSTPPTFDHGSVASHSTPSAGQVTLTGGNTGGTLTFNNAFGNAPFCIAEDVTTKQAVQVTTGTSASQLVLSGATANDTVNYICLGGIN